MVVQRPGEANLRVCVEMRHMRVAEGTDQQDASQRYQNITRIVRLGLYRQAQPEASHPANAPQANTLESYRDRENCGTQLQVSTLEVGGTL
jgi:hypothetical protein